MKPLLHDAICNDWLIYAFNGLAVLSLLHWQGSRSPEKINNPRQGLSQVCLTRWPTLCSLSSPNWEKEETVSCFQPHSQEECEDEKFLKCIPSKYNLAFKCVGGKMTLTNNRMYTKF